VNLYSTLLRTVSKTYRCGPCVTRGSHSLTCHPHTNHTCLYSPAARRHRPLAGIYCAYPRRDGQAEFTWVAGVAVWSRFTGRAYVLVYWEVTFAAWADGRCPRRAVWL